MLTLADLKPSVEKNEKKKQFMLKVQIRFKNEADNSRRKIINLLLKTAVPFGCSYWDKEGEIEHGLATIVKELPIEEDEQALAEQIVQEIRKSKVVRKCEILSCTAYNLYTWDISGGGYGSIVNQNEVWEPDTKTPFNDPLKHLLWLSLQNTEKK